MNNVEVFDILELTPFADEQQIRAAYRRLVKSCHPDQFQDPEEQRNAQEKLIALNLAYEEALKLSGTQQSNFNSITQEEAKHFAERLISQGNYESALRQLNRAETKDAEWFAMQGDILMHLRMYETAHQSYREAVRRDPDNRVYHAGALKAAVAEKKNRTIRGRLQDWVKHTIK